MLKPSISMGKRSAMIAALVCAMAGCATSPIPNERIAVARASVQRAEQAGANEFAAVELSTAKDKLSHAELAASHRDARPATDLAEQADVDAQLAEATARQQRSHKAAADLDASLQALRQETTRSSQSPQ